jgi:hypothetical protein
MVLSRLELLAILALQCSAAWCANRSGAIFTSIHVDLQMMEFVVVAQAFNTSMVLIATKNGT